MTCSARNRDTISSHDGSFAMKCYIKMWVWNMSSCFNVQKWYLLSFLVALNHLSKDPILKLVLKRSAERPGNHRSGWEMGGKGFTVVWPTWMSPITWPGTSLSCTDECSTLAHASETQADLPPLRTRTCHRLGGLPQRCGNAHSNAWMLISEKERQKSHYVINKSGN